MAMIRPPGKQGRRTAHVIDPGGRVRGSVNVGASMESALRVAWGLLDTDDFVVASHRGRWNLCVYRPSRTPPIAEIAIRSVWTPHPNNRAATRNALIDAAWQDLLDDGWSVRLV